MKEIASKLVKIMGECDYVQKGGVNKFHNYKYASAADVLEKVNAACVKHNVASVVSSEIIDVAETQTKSGSKERLVTVRATLVLIDGDSGESLTAVSLGTGQDPGDKAVAKAQTMALKYAWMTTLNISTGDDPEADDSVDERNHAKPAPQATRTAITTPPSAPQTAPHNPPQAAGPPIDPNKPTKPMLGKIWALSQKMKLVEAMPDIITAKCNGKKSSKELTRKEASTLIDYLLKLENGEETWPPHGDAYEPNSMSNPDPFNADDMVF
ncbi:MAG: ERF family protein [Dehalococcoidia bacterium]